MVNGEEIQHELMTSQIKEGGKEGHDMNAAVVIDMLLICQRGSREAVARAR